jgi:Tfp pilus assembly protein PilP
MQALSCVLAVMLLAPPTVGEWSARASASIAVPGVTTALALQSAAAPPAPQAPGQPDAASSPPETYTYSLDGRRDPFVSLLGAGLDQRLGASGRAEGVAGMAVAEISVRGTLQSRGTVIAMVQGPDNRTYIVHQGDKLLDGRVQSVTPEGLVIVQEVNDPLSLVKQRVIRKLLQSLEDARP